MDAVSGPLHLDPRFIGRVIVDSDAELGVRYDFDQINGGCSCLSSAWVIGIDRCISFGGKFRAVHDVTTGCLAWRDRRQDSLGRGPGLAKGPN